MGSDGITVFQRACLEHNLLSLSGVYDSVKLSELEHIVGGSSNQVLKVLFLFNLIQLFFSIILHSFFFLANINND